MESKSTNFQNKVTNFSPVTTCFNLLMCYWPTKLILLLYLSGLAVAAAVPNEMTNVSNGPNGDEIGRITDEFVPSELDCLNENCPEEQSLSSHQVAIRSLDRSALPPPINQQLLFNLLRQLEMNSVHLNMPSEANSNTRPNSEFPLAALLLHYIHSAADKHPNAIEIPFGGVPITPIRKQRGNQLKLANRFGKREKLRMSNRFG